MDEAIAVLRKAIELDPKNAESHTISWIHFSLHDGIRKPRTANGAANPPPRSATPVSINCPSGGTLVDLDRKLPAFLSGEVKPADSELTMLPEICQR